MSEQSDILAQGFNLMFYGMGSVFVFLTVLVFVTWLMSTLINRFLREPEPAAAASEVLARPAQSLIDPQRLRVLQAAVDAHRKAPN